MSLIAKHQNGINLKHIFDRTYKKVFAFCIPEDLITYEVEHLENNRALIICKCSFFDGYLGVGSTKRAAYTQMSEALERVLNKILQEGEILNYLRDKSFEITTWGSIADLAKAKIEIWQELLTTDEFSF